jgi:hypothetical protein
MYDLAKKADVPKRESPVPISVFPYSDSPVEDRDKYLILPKFNLDRY